MILTERTCLACGRRLGSNNRTGYCSLCPGWRALYRARLKVNRALRGHNVDRTTAEQQEIDRCRALRVPLLRARAARCLPLFEPPLQCLQVAEVSMEQAEALRLKYRQARRCRK
jgi:hypothetical protein